MRFDEILAKFPGAKESGDGWIAICPAHLDGTPSLSINEGSDGRTLLKCHAGCKTEEICAAVGVTMRDLFPPRAMIPAPPAKSRIAAISETFNWQKCRADFSEGDMQKLASERGLSIEFVRWLHAQGTVGVLEGKIAFANHGEGGLVVSAHVRLGGKPPWMFKPPGHKVAPLIFGDTKAVGFILAFESQWDAFAVMDKIGWHASNGLPDTAVFITRGAGNGKLIHGRIAPAAVCYAFKQNDVPTAKNPIPAGDVWLAEIASNADCKVLNVATPAPHSDANDWTRAGASEADLRAAMKAAKPVQRQVVKLKITGSSNAPSFDAITAAVRGEIVRIFTDSNFKGTNRSREVAKVVVAELLRVGKLYFHAERRDFESAMFFDASAKQLWRIRSDAFTAWLSQWVGINRADPLFKFIFAEVETAALSIDAATGIMPESFWATRPGAIYISNGDGHAVKITANSVQLVDNGTDGVLFSAGRTLQPWKITVAQDVFQTCSIFRNARCAASHALDLIRLWIYSLPTIPRSKPPLCLAGDIGSGKTRLTKAIAEFFGIPFIAAKVEESEESNFWPNVDAGGLFILDNADTKCRWLPDALANAATDGCSQRRKLYSNSETVTLRARSWLCVTTANPTFAADAGLADRLLLVRMARRDYEGTSDAALTDEILANRDAGLSHLAETLSAALSTTGPTPAGLNRRHPDFAAFAVRIGRALNREAEAVAALENAEADKSAFCLENDNIGAALLAYLRTVESFAGTANELAPHLIAADPELEGRLSAKRLGKRIAAIWPHLQASLSRCRREPNRNGVLHFDFCQSAGFAGFQSVISLKP